MPGPLSAGAGFLLAGLGYSAVYPLVVVLVGRQFPADESFVVGVVTTGGGIGSFSFPFFMAAISQRYGIWTGFLFFVGVNVMSVALMAAIFRRVRARTAGKADGEANVRDEHGN